MIQTDLKFERFSRKEQLDALEDLHLTSMGGVSAITLKAVLASIEGHARGEGQCWATQETIKREIGAKNVRTVKRAVKALQAANMITCERIVLGWGRWVNHHKIIWQEIRDRLNKPPIGDKMSPSLVTESHLHRGQKVTSIGDRESPALVTQSHLPLEKRQLNVNEPPPPNGVEVAEEIEFFQEQEAMPKRPTKKPPAARPILEADYEAAPTEHRRPTLAERHPPKILEVSNPGGGAERMMQPGSPEDLAASRAYLERARDVPGWSAFEQDRVRDMFAAAGVARAHDLMRTAIARGFTPEDCDAYVETMQNSVEAKTRKPLGPGALWDRITQGGWIPHTAKADLDNPNAVEPPDLAEQRRHAARRAENERLRAESLASEARRREREATTGKILDALPEEQLVALLARVPSYWHDGVNRRFTGERPIKFISLREDLFALLESEGTDGR